MPRWRVSLPIRGAGQNDPKYFDFASTSVTADGSITIAPLPFLFGNTGFHISIHPSGVKHIRTANPFLSKDIIGFEEALSHREYLKDFLDRLVFEPPSGYEALILISKDPSRFIVRPVACRFFIDLDAFMGSTKVFKVEDTANLFVVLGQLRAKNYFADDSFIMIVIPELEACSIFKPAKVDARIVGTSSRGLRLIADYGGFFGPLSRNYRKTFSDIILRAPLLQPLAKPMREIFQDLNEVESFPDIAPGLNSLFSQEFGSFGRQLEKLLRNPAETH
jgi:hypothetical protein